MFCIICNQRLLRSAKVFETPKNDLEITREELFLQNFFRHFQINLGLETAQWDLSQEDLPFCTCCKLIAEKLVELNQKIEMMKKELSETESWIKSQISMSNRTLIDDRFNKSLKSEDTRIQTIRDIIAGPCLKLRRITSGRIPRSRNLPGRKIHNEVDLVEETEVDKMDKVEKKRKMDMMEDDSPANFQEGIDSEWEEDHPGGDSFMDEDPGGDSFLEEDSPLANVETVSEESETGSSKSDAEFVLPGFARKTTNNKKRRLVKKKIETDEEFRNPGERSKNRKVRKKHKVVQFEGEERYLYEDELEFTGNDKDGYKCSHCMTGFAFRNIGRIFDHFKIHLENSGVQCSICGKICVSPNGLQNHIKSHDDSSMVICEFCGKNCRGMKALNNHLHSVHADVFKTCEVCGKKFKGTGSLNAHIKKAHFKEKQFFCDVCRMGFFQLEQLTKHVASAVHSEERKFACDICGNKFRQKCHLNRHKRDLHFNQSVQEKVEIADNVPEFHEGVSTFQA